MDCTSKKMRIIYGDATFGVRGERFHYIFSWQRGGPESFCADGKEWLYRTPLPTFWRATTDNDRGCGFPLRSGVWLAADMFVKCIGRRLFVDGVENTDFLPPDNNKYTNGEYADEIKVGFVYETLTVPATTVEVNYLVKASGGITVTAAYRGKEGLPGLPLFGMRFVMPTPACGFTYKGLSGETYPDRKAGGVEGVYEVEGMPVTPHLVPQECGAHMDTEWVEIYRDTVLNNSAKDVKRTALRIKAVEKKFAFSCLPYTAEELENALHQEELPPVRRTVLNVLGAMRGVGGIDSWMTDVEEAYWISAQEDICFQFGMEFV